MSDEEVMSTKFDIPAILALFDGDKDDILDAISQAQLARQELVALLVAGDHSEDVISGIGKLHAVLDPIQRSEAVLEISADYAVSMNLGHHMIQALRNTVPRVHESTVYAAQRYLSSVISTAAAACALGVVDTPDYVHDTVYGDMHAYLINVLQDSSEEEVSDVELLLERAKYMRKNGIPSIYERNAAVRELWPTARWHNEEEEGEDQ